MHPATTHSRGGGRERRMSPDDGSRAQHSATNDDRGGYARQRRPELARSRSVRAASGMTAFSEIFRILRLTNPVPLAG
jgi:hypothetical protein